MDAMTVTNTTKAEPDAERTENAELVALAYTVLETIESEDYTALSKMVHPEYGVVFSPYATITLSSSQCFTAQQVAGGIGTDENVYVWGVMDGSGDPIKMTPAEYFTEFVYDADYLSAPVIGVDHVVQTGNSLENILDVFPNSRFVEFHFPGTEEYDGMDWSTLRVGFEEYEGQLMLTAIIHSEWTV